MQHYSTFVNNDELHYDDLDYYKLLNILLKNDVPEFIIYFYCFKLM